MSNSKEDWEEIEKFIQNEKNKSINKYGIDINEELKKKTDKKIKSKNKNTKSIIRLIVILFIVILVYILICNIKSTKFNMQITSTIKDCCGENIEKIYSKTDLSGNGFYKYRVIDIPDIEIHVYAIEKENICIEDTYSRYYKYYFEKWQYDNKEKFTVQETYQDYKYKNITKEKWILNYQTYIEVTNYEEFIEATNDIINFIEYMGNNDVLIKSYIKFQDIMILPHNVSEQTAEQIMESAKKQWNDKIKE
jgi:hypothetical protein